MNVDLPNLRGADLLADGSRLHFQVYLQLRELVRVHVISDQEPVLSETPRPLGGYEAVEARGGYLSGVLQENRAYCDSYEAEPIRELILSPDFQDFEGDEDWVCHGSGMLRHSTRGLMPHDRSPSLAPPYFRAFGSSSSSSFFSLISPYIGLQSIDSWRPYRCFDSLNGLLLYS